MTTMKNNNFLTLLFILNKVVNFKGVFRVLRGIFMKSVWNNICAELSKLSEYGLSFVENCQEQVHQLTIMTKVLWFGAMIWELWFGAMIWSYDLGARAMIWGVPGRSLWFGVAMIWSKRVMLHKSVVYTNKN